MKPGTLTTIAFASLLVFTVAGCAMMKGSKTMSASDSIASRQRLMKNVGANWADAQAKAKAGNIEGVAVNAEALALHSMRITSYFPENSLGPEKTAAKPEIWQKWPDFEAAAKNLQVQSEKLRDVARTKDADATNAVIKDFGRQACGTCHTPFRVPPPPPRPA
jgi:cytochrome c556